MSGCDPTPDSGILCIHYGRNRLFGVDGYAHTRRVESDTPSGRPSHYIHSECLEFKQKQEINTCLNCTRKECTGGDGCFKKNKKKEVTQND